MRIFIISMDDPVQTYAFIKSIIDARKEDIIGLAIAKGDRMTIGKKKSKIAYLISLFLIMGVFHFTKNACITLQFKLRKILAKYGILKTPGLEGYALNLKIPVFHIKNAKDKSFLEQLRALKPDVIINQSQLFLKKELLDIPLIGTLNRHNALLPKNRGRLTPFWVLFKEEKETGVSIHFVTEALDAGDIVIQKKYMVSLKDNFNSLVKKNYEIAPLAMLEALDKLEKGKKDYLPNDENLATYNTIPTLKEAWKYRVKRIKKVFS